jgi:ATP-dependent Clp protease ATP-binding subunit ClpA
VLESLGVDRHELRQQLWLGILSETKGSTMFQPDVVLSMSQCPEILMIAVAETYKLKRSEIASDAIFLSLLSAGGKLIRVLEDFGLSYEFARSEVSKTSATGGMVTIQMRFTKCAEVLMQRAREEANSLGHVSVDARHILLAFTHDQDEVVRQILREKNVDIGALRAAVLALFEETS